MIDPIGLKTGAVSSRPTTTLDKVDAPAPTPRLDSNEASTVAESGVRAAAREMATSAPVDVDRVQQIKRAIQQGRFPIVPAKIADRLIAAQMDWATPNDQD
jgi:negative regulator of flagellin synthesis FlgM